MQPAVKLLAGLCDLLGLEHLLPPIWEDEQTPMPDEVYLHQQGRHAQFKGWAWQAT